MSQSYAYNANNPGHLYLNSPEFEKDLEAAAKSMKLSDAFAKDSPAGKFEWTATFVNLNRKERGITE